MKIRRHTRGTAMVEFIIILPILLGLLFAILEFGLAFVRWQTISNAAREGARLAVVAPNGCSAGAVGAQVQNVVNTYAAAANIDTSEVTTISSNLCAGTGELVTVRVEHDFDFPVLSALMPSISDAVTLVGTSVMRTE
jgi:Flp pilus assembly protein TadG